jgi:hypothetical protein
MVILLALGCTLVSDADVDAKIVPDGVETDSDADSDTDTDSDSDSDSDTDTDSDTDSDTDTDVPSDLDGDGYTDAGGDCDDSNASMYPGAPELSCDDRVVNDCGTTVPEAIAACLGTMDLSAVDAKLIGSLNTSSSYAFGEDAGSSVASAGDVNGDGYGDLLVGASQNTDGGYRAGAAYLVLGPVSGDVDLSTADAEFTAEETYDDVGFAIASAGDVNGDGYDDIVVGGPGQDEGGLEAGAAYLMFGPVTGEVDLSLADAKIIGEDANDHAGYAVASAGDMNSDGYSDLLVSAYCDGDGGGCAGAAYLILGPISGDVDLSFADAKIIGENEGDYLGYGDNARGVAPAGDVNGDSYPDLIVGAYGNDGGGAEAGAAYLVLGPVNGELDLSMADAKFIGEEDGDFAGYTVAAGGDVNGDGYDDLVVGSRANGEGGNYAGAAYLIFGPVSGDVDLSAADAKFIGESAANYAGVASAGDLNGDGYSDLLVGAEGNDEGGFRAGAAYLILGPVSGDVDLSTADAKFVGEEAEDYAGGSLAFAGDVNGDGYADLIVGAPKNDEGGVGAGAAYLILGGKY